MPFKITTLTLCALLTFSSLVGAEEDAESHPEWGYVGDIGPDYWATLSKTYQLCEQGTHQSPVDITDPVVAQLPPLQTDYQDVPLEIVNNGHTIKIIIPETGGQFSVGDNQYVLKQFHFHTPSEEAINGDRAELVTHLVHVNTEKDPLEIAVIAVLWEIGDPHPLLSTLWEVMPTEPGEPHIYDNVLINAEDLLPADRGYYHYIGSLTTPPCSEGVKWFILKQPARLSTEQLATFRTIYQHDARPLQPLNGRFILSTP